MNHRVTRFALGIASAIMFIAPVHVFAQACIGDIARPGEFSLGARLGLDAGARLGLAGGGTEYTTGLRANFQGPLALGGELGVLVRKGSNDVPVIRFSFSLDLPLERVALCPILGLGYSMWEDRFPHIGVVRSSTVMLPVGLSIGGRVAVTERVQFIPHASTGLYYAHYNYSGAGLVGNGTDAEIFVGTGGTLQVGRGFLSADIFHTGRWANATISFAGGVRF